LDIFEIKIDMPEEHGKNTKNLVANFKSLIEFLRGNAASC